MKNFHLAAASVLISLLAFSCAHNGTQAPYPLPSASISPQPTPSVVAEPSPVPTIQPAPVMFNKLSVGAISGASDAEVTMIYKGVELANEMLRSDCFKEWVTSARYTENQGLSQAQIFQMVTTVPQKADVEMYTGDWKANHYYRTIGYENDPFDGVVHMNRYFVNTAYMVADNLIHEIEGHSQGFRHDYVKATSQPYGMNYAYEGCSNQQQQRPGGHAFKPPGIRLEIRRKGRVAHPTHKPFPRAHHHRKASGH